MFALWALAQVAQADDNRAVEATLVGLGTAASGLIGGAGGGAIGIAAGASACTAGAIECWGPVLGGVAGAGIGATAGSFTAAGLLPYAFGLNSGPSLGYAGLGVLTGVSLGIVGAVAESDGLIQAGMLVGTLGVPVGAAIGAATAGERKVRGVHAAVVPVVGTAPGARVVAVF